MSSNAALASYSIKKAIRDSIRMVGLEVTRFRPRGQEKIPEYIDRYFVELYRKYSAYSMIEWQGMYAAYGAAKHIAINNLPGAVVECGVWKGGCMAMMAETCAHFGDKNREFYLYDTFAGMAEPGEEDFHTSGKMQAIDIYKSNKKDDYVDWCYGALEGVQALMKDTSIAEDKFHYVQGMVEDTIPQTLPEQIAVLRLDTDWYASTLHELDHMFPKLQEGGFLIIDDYGTWSGSKKALDEYFEKHELNKRMYLNVVHGHGSVIGQLMPSSLGQKG